MTDLDPPASAGSHARRWAVLATALAVVTVVLVALGVVGHQRAAAATASPAGPWFRVEPRQQEPVVAPRPVSPPVRLRIHAIGVSTAIVPLGLNRDRTVQVPTDPSRAGWYRLGTSPGQVGSAVILGHVDSMKGPAVFYRLRTLVKGDQADVVLADGSVVVFRVTRLVTYQNKDFPKKQVYGNHGRPTLTLVTCGGDYDRAAGGYQANVVVYTELLRSVSRPG